MNTESSTIYTSSESYLKIEDRNYCTRQQIINVELPKTLEKIKKIRNILKDVEDYNQSVCYKLTDLKIKTIECIILVLNSYNIKVNKALIQQILSTLCDE